MSKKVFLTVLVLMMVIGNALCYHYNHRPLESSTNILFGLMILFFAIKKERNDSNKA
jgi:hypothetical protein